MRDFILSAVQQNDTQSKMIAIKEGEEVLIYVWEDGQITFQNFDMKNADAFRLMNVAASIANDFRLYYNNIKI